MFHRKCDCKVWLVFRQGADGRGWKKKADLITAAADSLFFSCLDYLSVCGSKVQKNVLRKITNEEEEVVLDLKQEVFIYRQRLLTINHRL